MDLMQVLMEEYKMLGQVGEKYFDRLYQSLYFTIVFYGAVLAVMKSEDNEKFWFIIFCYFLPIGTFLFGLFYAYNSYVIARQGLCMIRLEKMIREQSLCAYKNAGFAGWNILSKKYAGNYKLAYGTSLMFFVFAPVFDYILGIGKSDFKWIINFTSITGLNILYSIFPILFYVVYVIFMIIMIKNMLIINKMIYVEL